MLKNQILQNIDKVLDGMLVIKNDSIKEECPIGIIDFECWEWPQGVGLYGLMKNYLVTQKKEYLDFILGWFDRRISEGLPKKNVNTMAPMLTLAYLYEITKKQKYLELCQEWVEWVVNSMPRTRYKGLQHIVSGNINNQQLWDDTLFMTVLFVAKMGALLNRQDYIDESIRQFLIHIKYLTDTKTGLWFHGWTFDGRHNFAKALWARGNCWITAAIPDYIEITGISGVFKEYLIDSLNAQVETLARLQNSNGMWHTVLDDNESYLEASATAGFGYGILKSVRMGYIDKCYMDVAKKALTAVLEVISEDGTVEQVSYGTGMGATIDDYKKIPICPMAYGQSLTLLFFNECLMIEDSIEEQGYLSS